MFKFVANIQNELCSSLGTLIIKLQLHSAIYRLRFYSNSLIHILSLSNSHNDVTSIQKNRGDKSHSVIVALVVYLSSNFNVFLSLCCHQVYAIRGFS